MNILDVFDFPNGFALVMPLYGLGSLAGLISSLKKGEVIKGDEIRSMSRQMLDGIAWLHSHSLIHRDVKPQNVLIESRTSNNVSVKLADFGFMIKAELALSLCGTTRYMAPETIYVGEDKGYTNKVDIWSLSCVMLSLLGLALPAHCASSQDSWDRSIGKEIERRIRNDFDIVRIKAWKTAERMSDYNPETRPSAHGCRELPLFQDEPTQAKAKLRTRPSTLKIPAKSESKPASKQPKLSRTDSRPANKASRKRGRQSEEQNAPRKTVKRATRNKEMSQV